MSGEAPDVFGQHEHRIRLDWGPVGARRLAADAAIVVDVLSFSTAVTIAVRRGTQVLPYPWRDGGAAAYAAQHGAVLAVGRLEAQAREDGEPRLSLSPAALLTAELPARLVLPSPNGSQIVTELADRGEVAVGCLRNANAAASWASRQLAADRSVALVAAGERWDDDDSLRPALEDHLGAGAIAAALSVAGWGGVMSPEARAAADLYASTARRLAPALRQSVGGRELAAKGFAADVDLAAQVDADDVVPVLRDGVLRG